MTGNSEDKSIRIAYLRLWPDGHIAHANNVAMELFELEHLPSSNLLDITKDASLRTQMTKCLKGEINYFIAEIKNQPHLFIFQRITEKNQIREFVVLVLNVNHLLPNSEENLNADLLSSIGQMSAGIAHEVRNPLTSVKGFLQLLEESFNQRYLEIAKSELDRAVNTLNDLLLVSRPNKSEEPFVRVNLCSELESLLLLFQNQLYHIEIIKDMRDSNATIEGKQNQLKKALFNLIKNAIEAMPNGGTLTFEHYKTHHGVHFSISDTGTGIPQDKIALLGTPFFSLKNDGTGMGLTQVYATVKEHNGKIKVESSEGKGTTFHLIFPVTAEEQNSLNNDWEGKNMYSKLVQYLQENADQYVGMAFDHIEQTKDFMNDLKQDEEDLKQELTNLFSLVASNINHTKQYEILSWAEQEGTKRAKLDISITMMLEMFHLTRQMIWKAILTYYEEVEESLEVQDLFALERIVNDLVDMAEQHFAAYYVKYKDELLLTHRQTVEELSVPVIPLAKNVCILPLIGNIDTYRAQKIRERTLFRVKELKSEKLIIDISGVPYIDTAVVSHLFKIVKGVKLLGCQAILTGISAEIAETMIELGVEIDEEMKTTTDLQKALQDINVIRS